MLQVLSHQPEYLKLNGRLTTDFPRTTVPDWLNPVQRTQFILGFNSTNPNSFEFDSTNLNYFTFLF